MTGDGSDAATAMLGLAGFVLVAAEEHDGELFQLVETAVMTARCGWCGFEARPHGRRLVEVRDLPTGGRPVRLGWHKRVWRCGEPSCEVTTWTERSEAIRCRASLSERARREMCRRVGEDGHSVAQVARDFGVGWATAMAAVLEYGTPLVEDPDRIGDVAALGVDESSFQAAGPKRHTSYVTGFVDLCRPRLLDVVPGRSGQAVNGWLGGRPVEWLADVRTVALDPHRGYANGLLQHLGHVTVVIDHFHAIKLANGCIDDVRRRTQNDTLGHRGRRGDPLYGIRRRLLVAHERLTDRGWTRLAAGLAAGDPDQEVAAAYWAKELLRGVYAAATLHQARWALVAFYQWAVDVDVPEVLRLARTVNAWEAEILNYHTTRLSNGPTEAMNLLIKKIKRVGHGFRSFPNYRLRLLLHCGVEWHTPRPARLRGRQPRSVA